MVESLELQTTTLIRDAMWARRTVAPIQRKKKDHSLNPTHWSATGPCQYPNLWLEGCLQDIGLSIQSQTRYLVQRYVDGTFLNTRPRTSPFTRSRGV